MSKTWRQISLEVINEHYSEIKKAQPELSDAEILKKVSREHYPFFERENFPYQAWLKAVRDYKLKLGVMPQARPKLRVNFEG